MTDGTVAPSVHSFTSVGDVDSRLSFYCGKLMVFHDASTFIAVMCVDSNAALPKGYKYLRGAIWMYTSHLSCSCVGMVSMVKLCQN